MTWRSIIIPPIPERVTFWVGMTNFFNSRLIISVVMETAARNLGRWKVRWMETTDYASLASKSHRQSKFRVHHGAGKEANAIRMKLGNFDMHASPAYAAVLRYFGPSLSFRELKGIVNSVIDFLARRRSIQLDPVTRLAKRSLPLFIKYIQDNYEVLVPCFAAITCYDSDRTLIQLPNAPFYGVLSHNSYQNNLVCN